jgi:hypothetical protein
MKRQKLLVPLFLVILLQSLSEPVYAQSSASDLNLAFNANALTAAKGSMTGLFEQVVYNDAV